MGKARSLANCCCANAANSMAAGRSFVPRPSGGRGSARPTTPSFYRSPRGAIVIRARRRRRRPLALSGIRRYQIAQLLSAACRSVRRTHVLSGRRAGLLRYEPSRRRCRKRSERSQSGRRRWPSVPGGRHRRAMLPPAWAGHPPITSFRLANMLTGSQFDLRELQRVTGPAPFTLRDGVSQTVGWLRRTGAIT